ATIPAVIAAVVATIPAVIAAVKGAVKPWPAGAAVKAGVCPVETAVKARMVRTVESAVKEWPACTVKGPVHIAVIAAVGAGRHRAIIAVLMGGYVSVINDIASRCRR